MKNHSEVLMVQRDLVMVGMSQQAVLEMTAEKTFLKVFLKMNENKNSKVGESLIERQESEGRKNDTLG